jgi:hypothetical protein
LIQTVEYGNNRYLLAACTGTSVLLLDVSTLSVVVNMTRSIAGNSADLVSLYSNNFLAVGYSDTSISLWSLANFSLLYTKASAQANPIASLETINSTFFASSANHGGEYFNIWELNPLNGTLSAFASLRNGTTPDFVLKMAFDGLWLYGGCSGGGSQGTVNAYAISTSSQVVFSLNLGSNGITSLISSQNIGNNGTQKQ